MNFDEMFEINIMAAATAAVNNNANNI